MLLMVQAHVCDTLLASAAKTTPFFQAYWNLRGLTAPLFFMLSGFATVVASDSHWSDFARPHPRLWARLRRMAALLLIGYLFHVPKWSWHMLSDYTSADWAYLLRFNVLHCIAVSLLLIHVLMVLTPNKRVFAFVCLGLGVGTVALAPIVNLSTVPLPLPLSQAVRGTGGSLFPLFPFMAHVLIGAALARLYLDWAPLARSGRRLAVVYLASAVLLIGAAMLWRFVDPTPPLSPHADTARFFTRMGWAWVLFAALAFSAAKMRSPTWLRTLSANALSVYVLHLLVIYGVPGVPGLLQRLGPTLTLVETFTLGPLVLAGCATVMAGWDRLWLMTRTAVVARLSKPDPASA